MIRISILIQIRVRALPYFTNNLSHIYFHRIFNELFMYAALLSLSSAYIQQIGWGIGILSGLFNFTQISAIIEVLILIIGSLSLIACPLNNTNNALNNNYTKEAGKRADYSLIVLFSTLGSLLLISSWDLISMYLSIELQYLGSYVLNTIYRETESSTATQADPQYFLLFALTSCFFFIFYVKPSIILNIRQLIKNYILIK